jgi:PPM family protein phosphatase
MKIIAGSATDVGHVRDANEDRLLCGSTVFAVADGLGGHAAGEVAATIALGPLAELDEEEFDDPDVAARALSDAFRVANHDVLEAAREGREGMGTTLTAAMVVAGQLVIAHVGDSRAYLHRSGEPLHALTQDHTVVGEAVRAGRLDPAHAARHPHRNVLTRAVGLEHDIRIDLPPPLPLRDRDRVLLCSDGLTEAVADDGIAEVLAGGGDPDATCRDLVGAALAGGGPDNVTVVVLLLEGLPGSGNG